MIWLCGSCIILAMATITFCSQYIEPVKCFRCMTLVTVDCCMYTNQRKPALLMNLCDIINEP